MPLSNNSGAADIATAHHLQKLMLKAAIEQLERERREGDVKAQTLSAVAKIVKDCNLEIDWGHDEGAHLSQLLDGLNLDFTSVSHKVFNR